MRVAIVGGGLQGVEAVYLAMKAGWEVLLVDKRTHTPASGLIEKVVHWDVTRDKNFPSLLKNVDLIIPATENEQALSSLVRGSERMGIPFAFDQSAYAISSSKIKSNQLFENDGIPFPKPWPGCDFPLIAKPGNSSGSKGVQLVENQAQLNNHLEVLFNAGDWVFQEYVHGPFHSLEIIGKNGQYTPLQVTELFMDSQWDCKRVQAPVQLPEKIITTFKDISIAIAKAIDLKGIMDVEVILQEDQLKVLEVDARFPSQTPITVFWSTGINMICLLGELFAGSKCPDEGSLKKPPKGVILEHLQVTSQYVGVSGERIMADSGPLQIHKDFFGADEAITNYKPGKREWVATLIIVGNNQKEAWEKRNRVIMEIQSHLGLPFRDPGPR